MNQASIEDALRYLLTTDPVLRSLGVTGVWEGQAPQTALPPPYIIMDFMGLNDLWTTDGVAQDGLQANIKAVTEGHATETGAAIDERTGAILSGRLVVVGAAVSYLAQRVRPMPRYTTTGSGGRVYKHIGGIYTLMSRAMTASHT